MIVPANKRGHSKDRTLLSSCVGRSAVIQTSASAGEKMPIPAVLCIEDRKSCFAATRAALSSGHFEVVAATSTRGAIAAIRGIPRIRAAVLPFSEEKPEEHLHVATNLEVAKPGLPKLVCCLNPPSGIDHLHLLYINSMEALNRQLDLLITQTRQAVSLRKEAEALRVKMRRTCEETTRLTESLLEKLKPPVRPTLDSAASDTGEKPPE